MIYQSHRLRVEEKKVVRRLVSTITILFAVFMILVFAGLPMLAKIIVFFSSFTKDSNPAQNVTSSEILFPPSFNPIYEATNTSRISVSGYGEKNATVKLLVNNREQAKVQTDSEGLFKVLSVKLDEGINNITAQNLLDNKISTTSSPLYITYKKNPPKLEIFSPKDGDKFDSNHQNISIIGETEGDAKILINDRMAIVDPAGKFNYSMRLESGENTIRILATDIARNTTEEEIAVSFNPD